MRLSDLLRAQVLDAEGAEVGQVHDVRLVRDGPIQGAFGPAYRVQGLIVGGVAFGSRLGFDRAGVQGPGPVKRLFMWLHRQARFVDWSNVHAIEPGCVRLTTKRDDLPPVPPTRQ